MLENGKVVAGGINGSIYTVEIYDPDTENWTSLPMLNDDFRNKATLDILPNGNILVVGGGYGNNTAEIYDFDSNTWSFTPNLEKERVCHCSNKLINGKVIVHGGLLSYWVTETYNFLTNEWTQSANNLKRRANFCSVVLKDERIIAIAGSGFALRSEIYNWNNMPVVENINHINPVEIGQSLNFTFSISDLNQDSVSYKIDFGDSTTTDWSQLAEPGNFEVSHTYSDTGNYVVKFKTCDKWYFENPQTHNSLSSWFETSISVINDAISPTPDQLNNVKVFPNPFKDLLYIDFSKTINKEKQIQIYNSRGRLVFQKRVDNQNEFIWDAKDNKSGIYFVKIISNQKKLVKRVLLLN